MVHEKKQTALSLAIHYLIYISKAELDQLKEDLDYLGVRSVMCCNHLIMKPLLLESGKPKLTATTLLATFEVKWSLQGSNQREKEEAVIFGWTEYVHDTEGLYSYTKWFCSNCIMYLYLIAFLNIAGRVIPTEDPDGEDMWVDLGSIMSFATGSDHPPPLGFPNAPDIQFETDLSKSLPFASTCAPTLYLPLALNEPDLFKEKMDFAICCAHRFGIP